MNSPRLVLCELADANLPRLESYSPFCLKVHRALQLAGLSYERKHGSSPRAFIRDNPAGQVPLLLVNGGAIFDSTSIVTRIDALSAGALSGGLDPRARAEAFLWEEMADTVLNGFVVAARWIDEENWPSTRKAYFGRMPALLRGIVPALLRRRVRSALRARDVIRPDVEACWSRFEETLDRLDARAPFRGFWLGESPSRADVAIFAQLFSLETQLTPSQGRSIAARPRLSAWLRRVDEACAVACRELSKSSAAPVARTRGRAPIMMDVARQPFPADRVLV